MKDLSIQKYGGASVSSVEKIKKVALRIKKFKEMGKELIIVVSAMGKSTDDLLALAHQISDSPSRRELDVLLSTGEQVTIALLVLALHEVGIPAISFTGFQVKISTDSNFSRAQIQEINTQKLKKFLKKGMVCVVAGFQGADPENNITTFGRGGSDTSAVAIAAAFRARECEIFTDVEGVFTADPNKVPKAKKLKLISYEEMLELASLGANVLHSRSVEFAKKYDVTLHVRSSFKEEEGTYVSSEKKILEKLLVTGVTLKTDEARISVTDLPDRPGIAAELFQRLADSNINVDIIVQSTGKDKLNTISFTILKATVKTAKPIIQDLLTQWKIGQFSVDENISIVSAVGVGMKSHTGIASRMFGALYRKGINIEMISTSEIKISCVIDSAKAETALRLLHSELCGEEKT